MPSPFEIPLSPQSQVFNIVLSGTTYRLTFKWNTDPFGGGWFMDIANSSSVPLIQGIPLVTGADLLAQFEYVGIAGQLIVQTDHNTDAVPTYVNLGISSHVFYLI